MLSHIAAASALVSGLVTGASVAEPLFPDSVVSNDIDFITAADPAVPGCRHSLGQATQEMPGAMDAEEFVASGAHTFEVAFADGA